MMMPPRIGGRMIKDYGMTKNFKSIFTISEYYDRDRAAFYQAIQHVR